MSVHIQICFLCSSENPFIPRATHDYIMTTSSNGHIFRVTGHLCGNSLVTGKKDQWRRVLTCSFITAWTNGWVNNWDAIALIMISLWWGIHKIWWYEHSILKPFKSVCIFHGKYCIYQFSWPKSPHCQKEIRLPPNHKMYRDRVFQHICIINLG